VKSQSQTSAIILSLALATVDYKNDDNVVDDNAVDDDDSMRDLLSNSIDSTIER